MLINILGGITALVLAASAYLAWENHNSLQQYTVKKNEKTLYEQARENLKRTQNEIKITKNDLSERQVIQKEVEETLTLQQESNEDLKASIEDEKEKVAQEEEKLAELEERANEMGDVDELIAEVKGVKKEIQILDSSIVTAKSKRNALDNSSIAIEQQIAQTQTQIGKYSKAESSPNLTTRVSQVFNDYGFVTLSGGDNLGIITGSTLDVIRGGETIAKLLVTTVEPGSSAADIIPVNKDYGVSVYTGDKVVAGSALK